MNLGKKRALIARTFNVGKGRIVFIESRLNEIKEAITKQDMRDLKMSGAIVIKNVGGRKAVSRAGKHGPGSVRKNVKSRKGEYVIITRKLRKYLSELENQGRISREKVKVIRKKIRNRDFKSKASLKEYFALLMSMLLVFNLPSKYSQMSFGSISALIVNFIVLFIVDCFYLLFTVI